MSNEKPDLIERDAVLATLSGYGFDRFSSPEIHAALVRIPAATLTGTKPSIDWSHVALEFNWLALNERGKAFIYETRPERHNFGWSNSVGWCSARGFASLTPGSCDWKDSLVMRPGYKGE